VRLEVGRIVAAQGLHGEMRVLMGDPSIPLADRTLQVEGEGTGRRVERARPWRAGAIISLFGVRSRSEAERLIGRRLYGDEEGRPELGEGRFYVHDLIGCDVLDEEGRLLGRVNDVEPKPAQDIWVVEGPLGTYLIPAARAIVLAVDLQARRITVRGGGVLGPDTAG
jgi:16S rRNA processing protein RimM